MCAKNFILFVKSTYSLIFEYHKNLTGKMKLMILTIFSVKMQYSNYKIKTNIGF